MVLPINIPTATSDDTETYMGVTVDGLLRRYEKPSSSGAADSLYNTRADAAADTIAASVTALRTAGYASVGDQGHGLYVRLATVPSAPTSPAYFRSEDRYTSAGEVDSTNGGYWVLVPDKSEVTIEQFGGKADFVSDAEAATDNLAPINFAKEFIGHYVTANERFPYRIRFGYGRYYFSGMVELHTHTHIIGNNLEEDMATLLYWPNTTTCILISQGNTSGESGTGSELGSGNSSTIEGVAIIHHWPAEGFDHNTPWTAAHGINARAVCRILNVNLQHIAGHAIWIHGNSGYGGAAEGAPNQWHIRDVAVHSCRGHGLMVEGADANAGSALGFSTHSQVGGCGIYDNSFYANTYSGIHLAGYGNRGVSHNGQWYVLISGSPTENPTHIGRTTEPGTNDRIWYNVAPGAPSTYWPAWSSSGGFTGADDYKLYRLPIWDAGGGRVYTGVYVENSNAPPHVLPPSFILGGTLGSTSHSGYISHGNANFVTSKQGIGSYREYPQIGSEEETRNGDFTYAVVGSAHSSLGMGAGGGIQFLRHARQSDTDAEWSWGYRGDDIWYLTPQGRYLWRTTTASTAMTFGLGSTQPGYNIYTSPIIFNEIDELASRKWTATTITAPTGSEHAKGEIAWHTNNSAGGFAGSYCTTTGTPGTWRYTSPIAADSAGTLRDYGMAKTTGLSVSNTTTITGYAGHLENTLDLGQTYRFRAVLDVTSGASGGINVAMGGTCASVTGIRYNVLIFDAGALVAQGRHAALGGATGITAVTAPVVIIEGVIENVSTAGTLRVEFAQNASNGTDTAILRCSTLQVINMA